MRNLDIADTRDKLATYIKTGVLQSSDGSPLLQMARNPTAMDRRDVLVLFVGTCAGVRSALGQNKVAASASWLSARRRRRR